MTVYYPSSLPDGVITTPIPASADAFEVVEICSAFVNELVEYHDAASSHALCGRLSHALGVLHQLCTVDLPSHRVTALAAEEIPPSSFAAYWGDSDTLLTYAQGVTQTLLSGVLQPAQAETMKGLLHDLVHVLEAYIQEPRVERVH
ncbi:hypothetical protein [Yokenella regensburgei]|uniref:Uncharacterized protein n=1 Tax=Yokenella regensburgei TaxID=158877 RepID=A0AB38G0U7_9ENTR|nr:hypothetical protein [Yokenella regensburgei]KFD22957.1 hypothetical protein GYRE_02661 [Yokenella regensburgei ATCC 49455]SQA64756.1 Uncharacterised protein [Yokenella regensburgei]SQA95618.1 Uncharacterised protein [Yokenella regensburgei]SUQ03740.1 Uncharacterised protein [Yokenella regensburgei]